MHYSSDIVAGIVLGLICGKVALYLYEHKINGNSIENKKIKEF
jgi:membrane-associated phospholipid phosphatase